MDSMQEQEIFSRYGWHYDYVQRMWISPNNDAKITTDELVAYNDSQENERRLLSAIIKYGVKSS